MAEELEKAGLPKRIPKEEKNNYVIRYFSNQCKVLYTITFILVFRKTNTCRENIIFLKHILRRTATVRYC
jgi:hypothetical protein